MKILNIIFASLLQLAALGILPMGAIFYASALAQSNSAITNADFIMYSSLVVLALSCILFVIALRKFLKSSKINKTPFGLYIMLYNAPILTIIFFTLMFQSEKISGWM